LGRPEAGRDLTNLGATDRSGQCLPRLPWLGLQTIPGRHRRCPDSGPLGHSRGAGLV